MDISRRGFLGAAAGAAAVAGAGGIAVAAEPRHVLVSVLTCPRPGGVSYVDGTLAAVEADVDTGRVLVLDGDGAKAPRAGWTNVHVPARPRHTGAVDNKIPGWVPFRVARDTGADLLFLEDDIRPLRAGAFRQMLAHPTPPGIAWTSFFHRLRSPGVYDAAVFDMSQAVLIPWRTLDALVRAQESVRGDWEAVVGIDLAIATLGRGLGMRYELAPNLVEHVGEVSAVTPGAA